MVKKKKAKRRKKRKKILGRPIIKEQLDWKQLDWKDRKPYKYLFGAFGITGLAIDGFASLLTWAFIIGTLLLIPVIWWPIFTEGFNSVNIFNNILLTLFLWVIVGFLIEEFEGLKSLSYILLLIVAGIFIHAKYENIKFNRCIDKFLERPNTFDKQKFIDCEMISESFARNNSLNYIKSQMYQKFYNQK